MFLLSGNLFIFILPLKTACWWAAIKIKCYLKSLVPAIEFFSKCMSKQAFNKIIVLADNAEFMLQFESTRNFYHKTQASSNIKVSHKFHSSVFSQWGRGWQKCIQATEIARKIMYTFCSSSLVLFFTCSPSLSGSSMFPAALRTVAY